MKIGIIGGGSVGLLIASYLSRTHNVTIYVRRQQQKEKINKEGLYIAGSDTGYLTKALFLHEMKHEELIIVCVKQPQLEDVLQILRQQHHFIPLIFLQNGMAHLKQIKPLNHPLFLGVVEHGALKEDDNCVRHTGKGRISIAAYQAKEEILDHIIRQLNSNTFPIEKSSNHEQLLTEKLMINAVINPLTAIVQAKNGSLITNSFVNVLAKQLCQEVADVLQLDPEEQWTRIYKIACNTSNNMSSMLSDVMNHRQTEIEAILGYLLTRSNKELPYTSFAYHAVKALEITKEQID